MRMTPSDTEQRLPIEFAGGRLRRLRPDDLACFQAYRALPELRRYQGWTPMSDADAADFLVRMHRKPLLAPSQWLQLGIGEQVGDALIGDLAIYLADGGRRCEIGYTLSPAAQGRGIATAAVAAAVGLLFAATDVREVIGVTDCRNEASARVLRRVGFTHRETREVTTGSEPCTEMVFALTRADL